MEPGVVTRSSSKRKAEECTTKAEDTCTICQEDMKKMDPFALPCGHSFHATCIMKNVCFGQLQCPLCRGAFAKRTKTDDSSESEDDAGESEYDEDMVQAVANRIETKFRPADVMVTLQRFRILTDPRRMTQRERCELLAEQLTHITDDEEE